MYDKSNLLELAKGLHDAGVRLLGSGGTAKKIREAGIPIEYVYVLHLAYCIVETDHLSIAGMLLTSQKPLKCLEEGSRPCTPPFMEVGIVTPMRMND